MIWLQCGRKLAPLKSHAVIRLKDDPAMLVKEFLTGMGCLLAWFVVLPVLAILGGTALFLYATLAEITSLLTGTAPKVMDASVTRLTARRICAGYTFSRS